MYDSLYDRFQLQMDLRAMLGNKYVNINRITIDADHVLWIASSFGLYRYTGDSIEKLGKKVKMYRMYCQQMMECYLSPTKAKWKSTY